MVRSAVAQGGWEEGGKEGCTRRCTRPAATEARRQAQRQHQQHGAAGPPTSAGSCVGSRSPAYLTYRRSISSPNAFFSSFLRLGQEGPSEAGCNAVVQSGPVTVWSKAAGHAVQMAKHPARQPPHPTCSTRCLAHRPPCAPASAAPRRAAQPSATGRRARRQPPLRPRKLRRAAASWIAWPQGGLLGARHHAHCGGLSRESGLCAACRGQAEEPWQAVNNLSRLDGTMGLSDWGSGCCPSCRCRPAGLLRAAWDRPTARAALPCCRSSTATQTPHRAPAAAPRVML